MSHLVQYKGRAGMFGAADGLIRLGSQGPKVILTSAAGIADSGPTCQEAKFWKNWTFSLAGTFTGYSVTIYGTTDAATAAGNGNNWFVLPGPAEQSGTGIEANPLTSVTQSLSYRGPLMAVRALANGTGQTGTVNAQVLATP